MDRHAEHKASANALVYAFGMTAVGMVGMAFREPILLFILLSASFILGYAAFREGWHANNRVLIALWLLVVGVFELFGGWALGYANYGPPERYIKYMAQVYICQTFFLLGGLLFIVFGLTLLARSLYLFGTRHRLVKTI